MGILVADGILPSKVHVSNVYMSFSGQIVFTFQNPSNNTWVVSSKYRVFSDETKVNGSDICIELSVETPNISDASGYSLLYQKLKEQYQGAQDC